MKALNICKIIGHCTAFVLHISLRKFQIPSTFRLGEITVGVTNKFDDFKNGSLATVDMDRKNVCKLKLLDHCIYSFKLNDQKSTCTMINSAQPRSQGFSLFVIGKAGKGPGTGRSSMYSDWSMTSTLLCK